MYASEDAAVTDADVTVVVLGERESSPARKVFILTTTLGVMKLAKKIENLKLESEERMLNSSPAYQYGIMVGSTLIDLAVVLIILFVFFKIVDFLF